MKVVINKCFGGFGLSVAAYKKLIEWGVPVRKYEKQEYDISTKRFIEQPLNNGEVIFDRELTPIGEDSINDIYHKYKAKTRCLDRYWDNWTRESRGHPLVIRVVEELGKKADGPYASLAVIEIPDGIDYSIDEYDGMEQIAETHRTWS